MGIKAPRSLGGQTCCVLAGGGIPIQDGECVCVWGGGGILKIPNFIKINKRGVVFRLCPHINNCAMLSRQSAFCPVAERSAFLVPAENTSPDRFHSRSWKNLLDAVFFKHVFFLKKNVACTIIDFMPSILSCFVTHVRARCRVANLQLSLFMRYKILVLVGQQHNVSEPDIQGELSA